MGYLQILISVYKAKHWKDFYNYLFKMVKFFYLLNACMILLIIKLDWWETNNDILKLTNILIIKLH